MSNPIFEDVIDHPAAWRGPEIGGKEGLVHRMAPEHVDALWSLVDKTRHKAPTDVTREEFDDPLINDLMTAARFEIMQGRGAVILSGLDMTRCSLEDYQRIYWGLGTHLGVGSIQSVRQDKIGFVEKLENNPEGRGYNLDIELRSHTDFHEILALASFRAAPRGGESGLVSSLAIHNAIRELRPDLLPVLYEGFYHEMAGSRTGLSEEKVPIFCNVDGKVSCYFHPLFIWSAAKQMGVETPPELEEAIAVFTEQSKRPDLRLDFVLQPGEMMFWHNFMTLHSRRAFQDSRAQKRLLLRLWLNPENGRPMHPSFLERAAMMDELHARGEPAIHYAKTGMLAKA